MQKQFDLILTIVNKGFAEEVMDAARDAGATGGTILHGRGTGVNEAIKFFGVSLHPEKEIVMILASLDQKAPIMQAIAEHAGLNTSARGISFSLPVDDVLGIVNLLVEDEQEQDEKTSGSNYQ